PMPPTPRTRSTRYFPARTSPPRTTATALDPSCVTACALPEAERERAELCRHPALDHHKRVDGFRQGRHGQGRADETHTRPPPHPAPPRARHPAPGTPRPAPRARHPAPGTPRPAPRTPHPAPAPPRSSRNDYLLRRAGMRPPPIVGSGTTTGR